MNTSVELLAPASPWLEDFQRFHARAASEPLPRGQVKLLSWPDLAELPDELVGLTTRVCALLWCKPTASYLVARTIGADPAQVAAMLRLLQARGHVDLLGVPLERNDQGTAEPASAVAESAPQPATEPAQPAEERASFIGKLWQRLLG